MRYTATISYAAGGDTWEETFDDPAVTNDREAEAKARGLVDWFNNALRPGERPRAFHAARVIGESIEHQWEKVSLVTVSDHLGTYDRMKCACCGITGKRFGIGNGIKRDSVYRARKYKNCEWRKKHA